MQNASTVNKGRGEGVTRTPRVFHGTPHSPVSYVLPTSTLHLVPSPLIPPFDLTPLEPLYLTLSRARSRMAPNPSPITSSILRTPEFIIETLSPNSFPPPQQPSPRPVKSSIKKQLHLLLSLLKGNKCGTRSSREIRGMQVINFRLAAGGGGGGQVGGGTRDRR